MRFLKSQKLLDRIAMAASGLCAVHCLFTPVLIVLVPVVASSLLADETFHQFMLLWVVPTSVLALWIGCRRHRDGSVLFLGIAALLILITAALWGHELFGEHIEKAATILGSLVLIIGHWRNYRLCPDESYKNTERVARS